MESEATNTLIITNICRERFSELQAVLRSHVEREGLQVVHWAPLRSFGRVLVVLVDAAMALRAKTTIEECHDGVRVFFSETTPLYCNEEDSHLQLPDRGKLWLISPPPSPPVGWESRMEDEPNRETEHGLFTEEQLHKALARAYDDNDSDLPDTVQTTKQTDGRLTRRYTLHESPKLSLDTSSVPKPQSDPSPASIETPTIVLEWEDDDQTNPTLADDASRPDRLKDVRTEIPPV
ncbi:hypothetical protein TRICI_002553 [Trichomonascus ciferrii]|uniref:Calcipressin n=1 Tax=Trichomonascus ciferrii TaxID=44093 RepID=A0A642V5Z1_9ASCO|nr:hypothetical protein TRICI_002553 [Trichomonascus ciferrii]